MQGGKVEGELPAAEGGLVNHEHMPEDPFAYCPLCAETVGNLVMTALARDDAEVAVVCYLGKGEWYSITLEGAGTETMEALQRNEP